MLVSFTAPFIFALVSASGQAQDEVVCTARPSTSKRFEGKVIAISGASSGIGEVIAKDLARDGATVVLGARRGEKLSKIVEEIKANGGQAMAQKLDVTDYTSCVNFVQSINNTYGRLDGAFNNAGGGDGAADFMKLPVDAFKREFDLNFWGTYNMMKAELHFMTERTSGSIVNNLSLFASRVFTQAPAYTAAKHAAKSLQEVAAVTVAGTQVRINSVSPGWTLPSEGLAAFLEKAPDAKSLLANPQGRMMDASKDVYPVVAFLLDDISSGITGTDMPISGGHSVPTFELR